ncbi:MAG: hypothetical protein ACETVM_00610 [Candidatus Bathyarchaeia archaeon]
MKTKVALLLILMVFAFTPIITTLATTFITPTINIANLAKGTAFDVISEIQFMPDPVDSPIPPG